MSRDVGHSKQGLQDTKMETTAIPWWVKSIVIIAVTATVCYKVIATDFNMAFDFTSFLSLALALFSVLLAALFYFKATDTSNSFYDNTYKFTQDIAQLLVKIESGFGEKLTHLDDSYRGMVDRFDNLPARSPSETEEQIEESKEAEAKLQEDLTAMFEEVLDKTNLGNSERNDFLVRLNEKEQELSETKKELARLSNQLECTQSSNTHETVTRFFLERVIPNIGIPFSPNALKKAFFAAYRETSAGMRETLKHSVAPRGGELNKYGNELGYALWREYNERTRRGHSK